MCLRTILYVLWRIVSSIWFQQEHPRAKLGRDKINVFTNIRKLTVFTLCSNADSFQVLLHHAEKYSISLVEQLNITYNRKEPKRYLELQRNDLERYVKTSPVFGFNSSRYDLNLIKSYLIPYLICDREIEPTVIKKQIISYH